MLSLLWAWVQSLVGELGFCESEVAQLWLTLCDPMDLSGSSIHEIFQVRILEWVAISFSRGYSQPQNRTQIKRVCDTS